MEVPLDVGLFERHDLSAELVVHLQNDVMVLLQGYIALAFTICGFRFETDHLQ